MKKLTITALLVCMLCTSCVIGVRSNMNFINHKNHAETEATLKDASQFGNGSPAVNADKNYEDLLNGSGNSNGQNNATGTTQKAEETK